MNTPTKQFGTFDTLGDRKDLMRLFALMGSGAPADRRRGRFLRSLLPASANGFAQAPVEVRPCSAVDAYLLFGAIVGVLGVDIAWAARKLEEEVRKG